MNNADIGVSNRESTVALVGEMENESLLSKILDEEGIRFETFDEVEGLEQAGTPDCVVTSDAGFGILEKVRKTNPSLPFVLVSDGSTTQEEAAEAGVDEYVETPIGEAEERMLLRRLRRYAEGHRSKSDEKNSGQVGDGISQREDVEEVGYLRERHETIIKNIGDPTFLIDVEQDGDEIEFVFDHINPAYEENVGVEGSDIRGKTPREVFGEETGAEFEDNYRRCVEESRTLSYEEIIELPSGVRTYHTKISPVCVDRGCSDGEVLQIVGIARDITETKEREKELKRYEEFVENTTDIITHLNEEGNIIYQSPSVERILDYPQEERIGEKPFKYVHPDDKENVVEKFTDLITGKTKFEDVQYRFEKADGSYVWLESVAHDKRNSELGGILVSSRDITERKKYQRELEKFREFVENSSDLITLLNEDSTINYQNSTIEKMLGYEQGETVGDSAFDYVHPDDKEYVMQEFFSLVTEEDKTVEDVEFRYRHADGSYIWLEAIGVDRTETEIGGVIVNLRDVTERREREQKLRDQKEQIEFFNSLLRHDLLNSITVVRGNAELLMNSLSEDTESHEYAQAIHERSEKIVELTNRVRSVLRRVTEEDDKQLTSQNLTQVVEESTESLEEGYEVDCRTDMPDEVYVKADSFLNDVIDNILINSVEHNDKQDPVVDVTVTENTEERTVITRIADNGVGVSDDRKEEVFQQGARGETSGGVGFGLYFVQSMVSAYGGEVWIEDNEPEGAVVVIELPSNSSENKSTSKDLQPDPGGSK